MTVNGKLLLIDDDFDDRSFFTSTLKSIAPNIICDTAKSGNEGLTYLQIQKTLPSLIFLDINMPDMNAWNFITEMRNYPVLKDIPVIIYSTSSHKRDLKLAANYGAVGYCTKPEELVELSKVLDFIVLNLQSLSFSKIEESGLSAFKSIYS